MKKEELTIQIKDRLFSIQKNQGDSIVSLRQKFISKLAHEIRKNKNTTLKKAFKKANKELKKILQKKLPKQEKEIKLKNKTKILRLKLLPARKRPEYAKRLQQDNEYMRVANYIEEEKILCPICKKTKIPEKEVICKECELHFDTNI